MTYSLHPEATKEIEEALAFYREQGGIGPARAFLAELERVATLLVSNPDSQLVLRAGLCLRAAIQPGLCKPLI